MRSPDARGQQRGALVLNGPVFDCRGKHVLLRKVPRQKAAAQWRLCLSSCDVQREKKSLPMCVCVCVYVRQTDSVGRLNESYNVNQAQSN